MNRIEKGVKTRPWWLMCVLTFAQRKVSCPWDAYRIGYSLWDKRLKRRLERRFGRVLYLQTWEAHRSGWPHLNLLLGGDGIESYVRELPEEWRWTAEGAHGKGRWAHWTSFRRELRDMVGASGLQRADWVEIVDSPEGYAAYFAKIAHELTSARLKAGDQTPIMAPAHFRRFRGSRGLIPKAPKLSWESELDETTGELSWTCRTKRKEHGDWTGCLSPRPIEHFDQREPTWSEDWREAMEYTERCAAKRAKKKAEREAGTLVDCSRLER